jgi:hypothetical protein
MIALRGAPPARGKGKLSPVRSECLCSAPSFCPVQRVAGDYERRLAMTTSKSLPARPSQPGDFLAGPSMGSPGTRDEEFPRNAHADIPTVVEAMRRYRMPIRYARAGRLEPTWDPYRLLITLEHHGKVIHPHGSTDDTPSPSITDLLRVNRRDLPATHLAARRIGAPPLAITADQFRNHARAGSSGDCLPTRRRPLSKRQRQRS